MVLVALAAVPAAFRDAALRGTGVWSIGCFRTVLGCAGAYVSGAAGSNECPAGSARIETEAACRTAAAAAGKTPSTSTSSPFVVTSSYFPRGCYYTSTNNAYFNAHAVGAGYSTQLLCAALVTTGAPPPHAADARARVSTGACVLRGTRGRCAH
jgi:hypothetical protein